MLAQVPTPVPRLRVFWGEGGHLPWLGESGTGGGDWELGSSTEMVGHGLCHLFRLLHSLAASLPAALVGILVFNLWPYRHGHQHTMSGWSWWQGDGLGGSDELVENSPSQDGHILLTGKRSGP